MTELTETEFYRYKQKIKKEKEIRQRAIFFRTLDVTLCTRFVIQPLSYAKRCTGKEPEDLLPFIYQNDKNIFFGS